MELFIRLIDKKSIMTLFDQFRSSHARSNEPITAIVTQHGAKTKAEIKSEITLQVGFKPWTKINLGTQNGLYGRLFL